MPIDLTAPMTITAPAGVDGYSGVATLNDTTLPLPSTHVGVLTDASGFDGPSVRAVVDDVPEGHGAVAGNYYHGARPFTLEVEIARATTWKGSFDRRDLLYRATNAMAADLTVDWTETGSTARRLYARREGPPRGPDKDRKVLLSFMAHDPRIYQVTAGTPTTPGTLNNIGTFSTYPVITITSPSNPVLTNTPAGGVAKTLSLTLSGGAAVVIDFAKRTVMQGTVSRYNAVNFPVSTWWDLAPGNNVVAVSGGTASIVWYPAWI